MLERLIAFDHELFGLINSVWVNSALDPFFLTITDLHKNLIAATVILFSIALALFLKNKKKAVFWFFSIILIVSVSDFIGGKVIKPSFERLRPPLVLSDVIVRSPHFGGYSFTSNHASNVFCLSVVLSALFLPLRIGFLSFAALVAYSRVYNGVHFPSDVFAGAIVGILIGLSGVFLMNRLEQRIWRSEKNV